MKKKVVVLTVILCAFAFSSKAQGFQWARQFASSASLATDVVVDHNRNVISTGWFKGQVDLDPGAGTYFPSPPAQIVISSYISKLDVAGNFVWGVYYNTGAGNPSDNVRIHSVDVDDQNNIVVMGMYRDSINLDFSGASNWFYDPTPNSSDWDNIFIAKYNQNSNYIWGKSIHSSITVNGYGLSGHKMKVDGANNIILSGRFNNTVDFDPGPGFFNLSGPGVSAVLPFGDKFLLKLDSTGNFMWVRNWEDTENWVFNSAWYGANELDVDTNNNVFLTLSFLDTLDVNPQAAVNNIYSRGEEDIVLVKISPNGNFIWQQQIGDTAKDFCNSLATDLSGNIFYTVRTNSGRLDLDPGAPQALINWPGYQWGHAILKLDNNGNYLWAKPNMSFDTTTVWSGDGIATNASGDLYLTSKIETGSSNGNQWDLDPGLGTEIVNSSGNDDIALQNLDPNGNFIWGGVLGGNAADWSYNICTDTGKGVYLTGYFFLTADLDPTPQAENLTNTGTSYDAFVVKLNNCNVATVQLEQKCDSVLYNSQVFYSDTIFKNYYSTYDGCDSIHSVVIDVTKHHDTIVVDTCKFYVWHGTTYINSGFYVQNYGIVNGCDSSETLDLTIFNDTLVTVNITDCHSALVNGISYTQTGSYYQYYTTLAGCDSNYLINFTKLLVDTSVTVTGSQSLVANAVGATFQWIDCGTLLPIPGATNVFFNVTQTGSYACVVTQNGCTDTSSCYPLEYSANAIQDYSIVSKIYPNPSKGSYHLELDKEYNNVQLEIRSMSGQLVWKKDYKQLKETNIKIENATGVYMLYIKQGERTQVKKLLKW